MDKYRKVKTDRPNLSVVGGAEAVGAGIPVTEGQLYVSAGGKIRTYLTICTDLLAGEKGKVEGITVVGLGDAINKAVTVAECVKRLVPGVHQITQLARVSLKEEWTPIEEGLDTIETSKVLSCITLFLTTNVAAVDTNHTCYQAPLPEDALLSSSQLVDAVMDDSDKAHRNQKSHQRHNSRARSAQGGAEKKGKESGASGSPAEEPAAGAAKKKKNRNTSRKRRARKGSVEAGNSTEDKTENNAASVPARAGNSEDARGAEAE